MSKATDYAEAVASNPAPAPFQFSDHGKPGFIRASVTPEGTLSITQPAFSPPDAALALGEWILQNYGDSEAESLKLAEQGIVKIAMSTLDALQAETDRSTTRERERILTKVQAMQAEAEAKKFSQSWMDALGQVETFLEDGP